MSLRWFVIQTYTGKEHETIEQCRSRVLIDGESVFCPIKEKMSTRRGEPIMLEAALFPGYVFAEIQEPDIEDFRIRLRRVPEMTKILRTGDDMHPIYPEEEEYLRRLLDDGHRMRISEGYMEGETLHITGGPLVGLEGSIKKVLRHQKLAVLEIPLMGHKVEVTVGLGFVERVY